MAIRFYVTLERSYPAGLWIWRVREDLGHALGELIGKGMTDTRADALRAVRECKRAARLSV